MKRFFQIGGRLFLCGLKGVSASSVIYMLYMLIRCMRGNGCVYSFDHDIASVFLVGLGFGIPSIIYSVERFSFWVKAVMHMTVGCGSMLLIYEYMIPRAGGGPQPTPLAMLLLYLVIAVVVWIGFFLYYKCEAKKINDKMQGK